MIVVNCDSLAIRRSFPDKGREEGAAPPVTPLFPRAAREPACFAKKEEEEEEGGKKITALVCASSATHPLKSGCLSTARISFRGAKKQHRVCAVNKY